MIHTFIPSLNIEIISWSSNFAITKSTNVPFATPENIFNFTHIGLTLVIGHPTVAPINIHCMLARTNHSNFKVLILILSLHLSEGSHSVHRILLRWSLHLHLCESSHRIWRKLVGTSIWRRSISSNRSRSSKWSSWRCHLGSGILKLCKSTYSIWFR